MRKLVVFLMVVAIALTLMGGLALAGGWTPINYSAAGNATDPTSWNPLADGHPHGTFSSSSNKCKVCHAVHLADGSTWRLLNGATSAATECDGCHGPAGFTVLRPYDDTSNAITVQGEHRRDKNTGGDQDIPDAVDTTGTNNALVVAGGLICNSCHSVHGANTLSDNTPEAYAATNWDDYILRKDPNVDGQELGQNTTGSATLADLNANADAVKSAFCADCHNKNPNWGSTVSVSESGARTNGTSHIQGPTAQGKLSVGGVDTSVAGFSDATYTTAPRGQSATQGCRSCHSASDAGNNVATGAGKSAFPHRTTGSKLLYDGYNGENSSDTAVEVSPTTGDPNRALGRMDRVCGGCHDDDGNLNTAGAAGVGQSF